MRCFTNKQHTCGERRQQRRLQFLWVFFKQPRSRWLRVTQGLFAAGAVTVIVTPGLIVPLALLQVLQFSVIPLLVASVVLTARRIAAGDREARLVGVGMIVLAATIAHDALVDRNYIVDPRIAIYGFAFLVAGMSVTLGNRFQRALRERDALLRELEARVEQRTHALSEAYRDMMDLASHDTLTRVMNRRAIHDRAESELARARRHQLPFTIALVDIDHFKAVNDTHGHAAGDQVLVQVSARLTKAVRASDEVGRWGGEEFLILMPGTDRREAAAAGERLRSLVARLPISIAENVVQNVTVSIGLIAVYIREVNRKGEAVWQINKNDLPGVTLYTVQEVTRLANGNTLINNWVGSVPQENWPTVVQLIEVTPDNKVVWALRDWTTPGPASSTPLLDEPGTADKRELQR